MLSATMQCSSSKKVVCRLASLLALFASFNPYCVAQTTTGTILGVVRDESGAVMLGVTITVESPDRGFKRTVVTDADGSYAVPLLPVGTYDIKAEQIGFKTFQQNRVTVELNQNLRLDIAMKVGQREETVTVNAGPAAVETRSVALGNVILEKPIKDLPLNGRNYLQLLSLQAGTISAGSVQIGSAIDAPNAGGLGNVPSVGGGRIQSNNFLLDGADNNEPGLNVAAAVPNPDTLQEFKVIKNLYSAEYGRNGSSIVNVVTKSGTNDFHGSAFEFFRNDKLDAKNFFSKKKESFRLNQPGGTIGGPVILPGYNGRNRTFFFASGEVTRIRQALGRQASVPSLLERKGDFSQSRIKPIDPLTGQRFPGDIIPADRIHPVATNLLPFYPLPDAGPNQASTLGPTRTDGAQVLVRIDHAIAPGKNNLMARYFIDDGDAIQTFSTSAFGNIDVPGFPVRSDTRFQTLALQDTHVISPRLLNEFRFGYNRSALSARKPVKLLDPRAFGFTFPLPKGSTRNVPLICVAGFTCVEDEKDSVNRINNVYTWEDSVSFQKGSHFLKFGGRAQRSQFNYAFFPTTDGREFFNGFLTRNAFADFLLGKPFFFWQAAGDPGRNWRSTAFAAFLQDEWRVTSRVTLNLGLRYEVEQPVHEEQDRVPAFRPGVQSQRVPFAPTNLVFAGDPGIPSGTYETDRNNFGPRIGLAWDVFGDGRTSLRAGYGIFYDSPANFNATNLGLTFPFFTNFQLVPPPGNIADPFGGQSPFTEGGPGVFTFFPTKPVFAFNFSPIDRGVRTPYVQQWNLTIQRQFFTNDTFEIAYVGSKATKLWGLVDGNPAQFITRNGVPPNPGNIDQRRPFGPTFGAIQLVKSRFNSNYNSLQVTYQKRYTRGLSFLAAYTWSKSIDDTSSQLPFLIRIQGQAQFFAQNPNNLGAERAPSAFDATQRLVISYNWELPWFNHASSGLVRQTLGGWQLNGIATFQDGTPFTVFDSSDPNFDGNRDDRPNLVGDPKKGPGITKATPFNTAAFQRVPRGSNLFGNAGRDILRTGGINNFDTSIFKNFYFSENHRERALQFRAELFNAFNHPTNFGVPVNDITSPNFGRVLQTKTFSQRVIQFAAKVTF